MKATREIHGRMLRLHESSYLSLMSIVQGLALGYLVLAVHENRSIYQAANWLLALNTAALVVLTWNEYVMGVASLDWVPSLIDSAIPFMFCASEIGLAMSISGSNETWCLWLGVFAIVSLLAFGNMYFRAARNGTNRQMLQGLGVHRSMSMWWTGGTAAIALGFGMGRPMGPPWLTPVVVAFVIVGYIARTFAYWDRMVTVAKRMQ